MSKARTEVAVLGLGTAAPQFDLDMAGTLRLLSNMFGLPNRVLAMIERQGVQHRTIMREPEWYLSGHSYHKRNGAALEVANQLTHDATKAALSCAGVEPSEIAAVVLATSTVVAMPGPDGALIEALGLSPSVLRVPIWGRGCAGGVGGLNVATKLSEAMEGRPVLFVAVECCTANVQAGDRSLANVLISAMYADGAAAVVVGAPSDSRQPRIEGGQSMTLPATADLSGWNVAESGLCYRFDSAATTLLATRIAAAVEQAQASCGLQRSASDIVLLQPVSADAINAQSDILALDDSVRSINLNNLASRGNLSGPAVLFALNDVLESRTTWEGTEKKPVVLFGTGPGYSVEQVVLLLSPTNHGSK
jgi:alkylresorcinol/alkylpyrone synthase